VVCWCMCTQLAGHVHVHVVLGKGKHELSLIELINSLREVYYEPYYPFAVWEVFMANKYL
jgi:hypothetical protein